MFERTVNCENRELLEFCLVTRRLIGISGERAAVVVVWVLPHDISKSSNFGISKFELKNRQTHDRDNNNNDLYVPTEKISPKGLMGWLSKWSNVEGSR